MFRAIDNICLFTLWTIKSESSVLNFVIVNFFSVISPSYVSSMYLLNITFFTYKLVLIPLNNCPSLEIQLVTLLGNTLLCS